MNWLIRKLAGAALAGIGWKLGADAYDYVKQRIQEKPKKDEDQASEEDPGPEATETANDGQGEPI